jgi:hypothetical protein
VLSSYIAQLLQCSALTVLFVAQLLHVPSSYSALCCRTYPLLVMTPAILVDRLVCESMRLQNIPLLIFDEAHHCRKGSPYKQIMQMYDMLPLPSCRPHIFGMTACPVNRKVLSLAWPLQHAMRSQGKSTSVNEHGGFTAFMLSCYLLPWPSEACNRPS